MTLPDDIPWLKDVSPAEMRRIVDALYRVHRLISVITDLNTLLERIMEESQQVANAEACSLMLYDADAEELYFQIVQGETGNSQALKRQVRLKLNQGIAGVAAATRQSINVKDAASDPRFFGLADEISRFKTRSLLAVPLLDRDTLVGVVEVLNKSDGGAFTDTDLHVMEMFATLAGTAIANARLIEENLRAERMAAIGQAVAGLSHFIKNIITGMSGSVELMDAGLQSDNREVVEKAWPILKRTTKRMSIFVQDMLAFSKPRTPMYQSCDLRALLGEVTETFTGLLPQKKVALDVSIDGITGPVRVDPQGLFSCLLNLLTNAADAVSQDTGRIQVRARTTGDRDLVIEVADNGPGIPEDQVHVIFEPFFSTKGSRGTGLGLAVTQKIVREHGGDITVGRSDLGPSAEGGALFRVVLPHACHH